MSYIYWLDCRYHAHRTGDRKLYLRESIDLYGKRINTKNEWIKWFILDFCQQKGYTLTKKAHECCFRFNGLTITKGKGCAKMEAQMSDVIYLRCEAPMSVSCDCPDSDITGTCETGADSCTCEDFWPLYSAPYWTIQSAGSVSNTRSCYIFARNGL